MPDDFESFEKVELSLLRATHQKRYQMMIDFVKEQIGEGTQFSNPIGKLVCSEHGAYCELIDLPEEFAGAAGDGVDVVFVPRDYALELLNRAVEYAAKPLHSEDTRRIDIAAFYTRRGQIDRRGCYIYSFERDEHSTKPRTKTIGSHRPDETPLYFKVRLDTSDTRATQILGVGRRLAFCLITSGDRSPLVLVGQRGAQLTDLKSTESGFPVQ